MFCLTIIMFALLIFLLVFTVVNIDYHFDRNRESKAVVLYYNIPNDMCMALQLTVWKASFDTIKLWTFYDIAMYLPISMKINKISCYSYWSSYIGIISFNSYLTVCYQDFYVDTNTSKQWNPYPFQKVSTFFQLITFCKSFLSKSQRHIYFMIANC